MSETHQSLTFESFLLDGEIGIYYNITNFVTGSGTVHAPDIEVYCSHCDHMQNFSSNRSSMAQYGSEYFFHFNCRNCGKGWKTFAVIASAHETKWKGIKVGEIPRVLPRVPTRLFRMIQPARELFIKGMRAEKERLGVGAYTYYRRIIEEHTKSLFAEILNVARREGASQEVIQQIESASTNHQFQNGAEMINDVIPQSLLIQGRNPLTLLYGAISHGIHAGTDEECLHWATSIRTILIAFTEKVDVAMKETREIEEALKVLDTVKPAKKANTAEPDRTKE